MTTSTAARLPTVRRRTGSPPTLIVHDRDAERIPLADGLALARLFPRAEVVTTGGLGHTGPFVDAAVVRRILDFFPRPGR